MAVLNVNDMEGPTLLRSVDWKKDKQNDINDIEYYAKYIV